MTALWTVDALAAAFPASAEEHGSRPGVGPQSTPTLVPSKPRVSSQQPSTPDDLPAPIRLRLKEEPALRSGLVPGGRSGQSYSFVALCMAFGYDDDEVIEIALDHVPTRNKWADEGRARAEIERSIEKLSTEHDHVGYRCSSVQCPHQVIAEIDDRLDSCIEVSKLKCWDPRRATLAPVMMFILALARDVHSTTFYLSTRTLNSEVHIARNSARNALRWLIDNGYLERVGEREAEDEAITYRLVLEEIDPHSSQALAASYLSVSKPCGSVFVLDGGHDLWASRQSSFPGLGKNVWRTHQALWEGYSTLSEIASAVGHQRRTVAAHLKLLAKHGLAEEVQDGKWAPLDADLDLVAEELGAAGGRKLKREQAYKDRERFKEQLERRAAADRKRSLPAAATKQPKRAELPVKRVGQSPQAPSRTAKNGHVPVRGRGWFVG